MSERGALGDLGAQAKLFDGQPLENHQTDMLLYNQWGPKQCFMCASVTV